MLREEIGRFWNYPRYIPQYMASTSWDYVKDLTIKFNSDFLMTCRPCVNAQPDPITACLRCNGPRVSWQSEPRCVIKAGTGLIKCGSLAIAGRYAILWSEAEIRSLLRAGRQGQGCYIAIPASNFSSFLPFFFLSFMFLLPLIAYSYYMSTFERVRTPLRHLFKSFCPLCTWNKKCRKEFKSFDVSELSYQLSRFFSFR
jgi:hypothetical protein